MDKVMGYLALARKGGMAELGEEPAGAAARAGKAHVLLVASDASDHTWRRALSFASGTDQQCLRLPHSKDEMGLAVGRQSLAIAAITDVGLALAMVQALGRPQDAKALEVLTGKAAKAAQRRKEAKAHIRNVRKGKK